MAAFDGFEDLMELQVRFQFRAVLEQAIRVIGGRLPSRQIVRSVREGGQIARRHDVVVAAETALGPLNEMNIPAGAAYREIVARIRGSVLDEHLRVPGEDRKEPPSLLHVRLIRFVVAYFERSNGGQRFDQGIFDRLWEEFLAELKRPMWVWVRRTPLTSFTITPGAPQFIRLEQNVVIRPIEDQERTDWDNHWSPDALKWPALARETHLLEIRYERPRGAVDLTPPFSEDEVLLPIRVLGHAVVSYRITEERLDSITDTSIHYANFNTPQDDNMVSLDATDSVDLLHRWRDYIVMRGNQRIAFSTRRFGDGHRRQVAEDKLVDYWTALESLYSRRKEKAEGIRRRLARRVAAALRSEGGAACRDAFDTAYASYKLRSKVVHGGPDQPITARDVEPVYELLRESLEATLRGRSLPDHAALDALAIALLGS